MSRSRSADRDDAPAEPGRAVFVVVVYDVVDDRRRTRLHGRLKNFGYPVQYSAFEMLLTGRQRKRLYGVIEQLIAAEEDRVRCYLLCDACRQRIRTFGTGAPTEFGSVVV